MTGSDEEGDWTLDIDPIELEDDARFQCQVGASEGIEPIRSRYATLTVLVPPTKPKLMPEGDVYRTVEGRQVELRCESRGGKPASEISWYDERNMIITEGVRTIHELMDDGKRFVSLSILRFRAGMNHNGKNITCHAQNSATPQPQSVSTRLEVHFSPHVSLKSDRGELLQEGDPVRFICTAVANPNQMSYAWYIGGKRVATRQDGSDAELLLENVERRLHNQAIRCEVTNPIGRSEKSTVLNIAYSPRFVVKPTNVAANLGDNVNLNCQIDSNPKPVYTWYRIQFDLSGKEEKVLVGNAQNLAFNLTQESAGRYECAGSVPGNVDIWARASVYLKGPPKIFGEGKEQFAVLNTQGRITCEAVSVPPVDRVEWFYQDQPVLSGVYGESMYYSVIENRTQDGVVSNLLISKVGSQDFGDYTCRVSNSLGSDMTVIKLIKENGFPLSIIIVGVIGGLILTSAFILIVVLCRRNSTLSCNSNSFKIGGNGSDITAFTSKSGLQRERNNGSDSDNSADYKVDIRTTSSLSNQDSDSNWDDLEERPTTVATTTPSATNSATSNSNGNVNSNNNNNNNNTSTLSGNRTLGRYPPQVMTNGGLVYHQHYANGNMAHLQSSATMQRPSSDYVDSVRLLTAANGFNTSPETSNASNNYDDYYANNHSHYNGLQTEFNALNRDASTRYSMHVSGSNPTHISPSLMGITVKTSPSVQPYGTYGYGGGVSSSKNVSFDYMPGSILPSLSVSQHHSASDNYAVYVNSPAETNYSPATTTSMDSGATVKVGSLATHV